MFLLLRVNSVRFRGGSGVLLAGVASTGEIHLERRCASEGTLKGVGPEGEFHEIP